jgi:hypothetical protein
MRRRSSANRGASAVAQESLAAGAVAIPLPETLPSRFTMEFDVTLPSNGLVVYFAPRSGVSDRFLFNGDWPHPFVVLTGGEAGVRIKPSNGGSVAEPARVLGVREPHGELVRLRIHADSRYTKVYLNEQRVANIPNLELLHHRECGRQDAVRRAERDGPHPAVPSPCPPPHRRRHAHARADPHRLGRARPIPTATASRGGSRTTSAPTSAAASSAATTPQRPSERSASHTASIALPPLPETPRPPTCRTGPQRSAARSRWARLLARIYEVFPLTCPDCGADMRILAFISAAEPVDAILNHPRPAHHAAPALAGPWTASARPRLRRGSRLRPRPDARLAGKSGVHP